MSTQKLLPCFVCGGEARLSRDGYSLELRVMCDECGARTEDFETDKEAISAWNRRDSPPAAVPDGWVLVPKITVIEQIDDITHAVAESRQGQSDTPRCEPPSEYDVAVARAWTIRVIKALVDRAIISAAPAAPNGWQDISTAPKEPTPEMTAAAQRAALEDERWTQWYCATEDNSMPAAPAEDRDG